MHFRRIKGASLARATLDTIFKHAHPALFLCGPPLTLNKTQEQNAMSKGPIEIKDLVKTYIDVDGRSRATNAGTDIERIAKEGTV